MSRRIHSAPFALASDGTVLVNIAEFDGSRSLESIVERARAQPGPVFIGTPITARELRELLVRLEHGYREAGACIVGARQSRARRA